MTESSPCGAQTGRVKGHALALAACVALTSVVTSLYVQNERTFYFWDYAAFEGLLAGTAHAFERSWGDGWRVVAESTREDYNAIFALPLLPAWWALGKNRLAFALGVGFAYVLPFALSLGAVAVRLIRAPPAAVFWSTTALALLTPMLWVPGFRGYPDAGGALLVALAVLLLVRDPELHRPWTIVGAGALLALAVVFRRHFLFAGPPVLVAVGLSSVLELRARHRAEPRALFTGLLRIATRLLVTLAAGSLAAIVVARPAVWRLVSHPFYRLYAGYLNPPLVVTSFFAAQPGALAWLGAVCGFAAGLRTNLLQPRPTLFLATFGVTGLVQWIFVVRQVGEQYTLHFTPTVVLGLAALGWTLWTRLPSTWHRRLGYAVTATLVFNMLCGLSNAPFAYRQQFPRSLFAANWPPRKRFDYDQVRELVDRLRSLARPQDTVFVAASSMTMNPDLLANAERTLYGPEARLEVLPTPAVDSRDQYPIEALLGAKLLVSVDPLQLHLPAEQQQVVAVVHDMFAAGTLMARDFAEVPGRTLLESGSVVSLFRRQSASSFETGLATLRFMESRFASPPGSQPDWAVVSQDFESETTRNADGTVRITWHPSRPEGFPPAVALYLRALPEEVHAQGAFRFVDGRCAGAAVDFSFLASDGSIMDAADVARKPGEPGGFEVSFSRRPESHLLLKLRAQKGQPSINFCLLQIEGLRVQ